MKDKEKKITREDFIIYDLYDADYISLPDDLDLEKERKTKKYEYIRYVGLDI